MPRAPKNLATGMHCFESPFGAGADREAFARDLERRGFRPFFTVFTLAEDLADDTERPALEWLELAAGTFLAARAAPVLSAREQRERLALIEDAALKQDRARLDRLLASTGGYGLPGEWLAGAEYSAVLFRVAQAKSRLARPRRSVPKKREAERILVRDLAAIWQAGTGRRPTKGWDGVGDRLAGEMADFLRLVLRRVCVSLTEPALAHLVRRCLPAGDAE